MTDDGGPTGVGGGRPARAGCRNDPPWTAYLRVRTTSAPGVACIGLRLGGLTAAMPAPGTDILLNGMP
jgi:hypothetical protein